VLVVLCLALSMGLLSCDSSNGSVETKVLELQVGPIRQQTWSCDSQSSIAREMR
jgi:hypothetical protein